ncbi:MAG: protein-methionine-sulfoxide reductase catalytic subunit MsrP [Psychromonas sp.]|nr:protein-methionine-sulfoxide reductase catalytic subunit MsrP [Psychromonas sp.]
MLIKVPKKSDLKEDQITDEGVYHARRSILKKIGLATAVLPFSNAVQAGFFDFLKSDKGDKTKHDNANFIFPRIPLKYSKNKKFQLLTPLTPEKKILHYNNFYEFGTGKADPFEYGQHFKVDPWSLTIDGLVDKPVTLHYEDLLKRFDIEERLYRMRCVEAWSMNIPWLGFSLSTLLKSISPKSTAKYVRFETLYDPTQMRGQKSSFIGGGVDFPYVEALRMDEAMNDLTLLSVGLYGKTLAPQSGAAIRLIVPWKYGFKGIKSIVKITLTATQPVNTWNKIARSEYGFYANVNPKVDHPRWSQASERFIGAGSAFSEKRKPTLMFNGYGDEVASLYKNLDLRKNF